MKTGKLGRVRHMEFRGWINVKVRIGNRKVNGNETRVFRNKNGMRGSEDWSSDMGLHRV